jgi:hypothetical protein
MKQVDLGGLFNIKWSAPRKHMLKEFLQTWEETKDGHVRAQVCGKQILIDQVLIHKQLGVSCDGIVDFANITFQERKLTLNKLQDPTLLWKTNNGTAFI